MQAKRREGGAEGKIGLGENRGGEEKEEKEEKGEKEGKGEEEVEGCWLSKVRRVKREK